MTFVVLGMAGLTGAVRAWPDGIWWPFALLVATSLGMLVHLRIRFRAAERVLLPVARG